MPSSARSWSSVDSAASARRWAARRRNWERTKKPSSRAFLASPSALLLTSATASAFSCSYFSANFFSVSALTEATVVRHSSSIFWIWDSCSSYRASSASRAGLLSTWRFWSALMILAVMSWSMDLSLFSAIRVCVLEALDWKMLELACGPAEVVVACASRWSHAYDLLVGVADVPCRRG